MRKIANDYFLSYQFVYHSTLAEFKALSTFLPINFPPFSHSSLYLKPNILLKFLYYGNLYALAFNYCLTKYTCFLVNFAY